MRMMMHKSPYYQPESHPRSAVVSTPLGESLPVVVIGAGPVGMAVALGLAQRGIPVTIIEMETKASYGSRAICISRHSLEIADRLGFGEALKHRALPWTGGRSFYRDHEVLHFEMPNPDHAVNPPMVNISQSEFEEHVLQPVAATPLIRLLWGVELVGIATDVHGAALTVATIDGQRTLRADRVVAADGGRSRTRELMGLNLEGTAYEGRYVIADIHWQSSLPTERLVWFDPPSNPGSTIIMHRQPDDIWRVDYQLSADDDPEAESSEEAITARITQHLRWLERNGTVASAPWTLEWHGYYKALALALKGFVHGPVIFAGDAAHLVPIFGVRGLNSGLEDADTLAWMLAAVIHGDASDDLLSAYSVERRDAWEQNIANAGKSTLIMTPPNRGYRATRDALLHVSARLPEFSHLIDPRQSRATHARRSPLTLANTAPGLQSGDPLEDRLIVVDGKETSLHRSRGTGFAIFAVGPVDLDALRAVRENLRAALPHEPVVTIPLRGESDLGVAAAWEAAPGEIVIVRPDGIVLARGQAPDMAKLDDLPLGSAPAPSSGAQDPVVMTAEQKQREEVWLMLSDAMDETDDQVAMLTSLALVLGASIGSERLRQVLDALA